MRSIKHDWIRVATALYSYYLIWTLEWWRRSFAPRRAPGFLPKESGAWTLHRVIVAFQIKENRLDDKRLHTVLMHFVMLCVGQLYDTLCKLHPLQHLFRREVTPAAACIATEKYCAQRNKERPKQGEKCDRAADEMCTFAFPLTVIWEWRVKGGGGVCCWCFGTAEGEGMGWGEGSAWPTCSDKSPETESRWGISRRARELRTFSSNT